MSQLTHIQRTPLTVIENLKDGYKKFVDNMRLIQQKRQTRKQLSVLPDYLLKDVGLNYTKVKHEMNKSYWTLL